MFTILCNPLQVASQRHYRPRMHYLGIVALAAVSILGGSITLAAPAIADTPTTLAHTTTVERNAQASQIGGPALSYSLDTSEGLRSLTPDQLHPAAVGHLLSATFLGQALSPDIMITDSKTSSSVPTVGVLSSVRWGGTAASPISMKAYVSYSNLQLLQAYQALSPTTNTAVFSFRVDKYDPVTRTDYVAFASRQPPLNAQFVTSARGTRELHTDSRDQIAIPLGLCSISFTVMPQPQPQELTVGTGASKPVVMRWGTSPPGRVPGS